MKTPHTVLVISADLSIPMKMEKITDFNDLNRLANCNTGTTVRIAVGNNIAHDLWIDDEGLFKKDPVSNFRASMIAGQRLVGDAVLTAVNPKTGATVDVDPAFTAKIVQEHEWRPSTSCSLANGERVNGC